MSQIELQLCVDYQGPIIRLNNGPLIFLSLLLLIPII